MEDFVNKTDVSFSQLIKKDGWFSRLIFIHLIVSPIYISYYWIFRPPKDTPEFVNYFISIAFNLMIGFLLWKKRTRFTITVIIILLWSQFARQVFSLLAVVGLLLADLDIQGVNESLIKYRINVLIYAAILTIINLVLAVIWTRNLRRLKSFYL